MSINEYEISSYLYKEINFRYFLMIKNIDQYEKNIFITRLICYNEIRSRIG